jgi:membrane protein required for colicin V production
MPDAALDGGLGALARLGWVDAVLLLVLAVSVVVGLLRGFVFEVMSLAGWAAAWFAAQWAAPALARWIPVGLPGGGLNLAAAFVAAFALALLLWSLLARLVKLLVHATPLSVPDRLLGAGFGALRAGVLGLALATVVGLTPAAQSEGWRQSHGARWLGEGIRWLAPLLPATARRWLGP